MFYLKEFFNVVKMAPIRGVSFLVMTFALGISLNFRADLSAFCEALSVRAYVRPYFTAFFNKSVDVNLIKGKLVSHPKVYQIQEVQTKEGLKSWWALLNDLGENPDNQELGFKGLRVLLDSQILKYDSQFILDSVVKLAGGEHFVTTSDVKYPNQEKLLSFHPFFKMLSRYREWTFIVPIAVIWMILYYLLQTHFMKRAFIIEHFQRKKWVAAKTFIAGILFFIGITFLMAIYAATRMDVMASSILLLFLGTHGALFLQGSRWGVDV